MVVVMLVIALILSAVSIALNVIVFKIGSSYSSSEDRPSSNAGNLGFSVEGNSLSSSGGSGG